MSRKRERAHERKERLRKQGDGSEHGPAGLEHASFAADEANAAVAAGAGGEAGEISEGELAAAASAGAPQGAASSEPVVARKGGARVWHFLRACWAELQRVRWPDREQVGQGTAVTLGFVVVAGAFLGGADQVAQRIVDLIL